jgi:two-component system cell cycle sensor histidine kinase/response regulator CckA
VGQLLAFSRKQVIEPRVMDLNSAIGQIHSALSRMIGEDIELRLETAPGLWRIRMDLTQLNQILMNMTANARDAMPNGGVLEIGTMNSHITEEYCREHAECAPGPYVCLTIRDNGIGIDEAVKSQLFEPFFTTKEMGRGTGLGLATVYGIVKQNSGFIEVDGSPGNGTCFRVLLPAAEECEAEPAEPESEDAVAEHIDARVLLVEDDSMVHRMTASMLRSIGCEVTLAENPSDALEVFKSVSGSLDLVILDVIMPGMNGARLRDLIRLVRPDMPVLFMSGYTSDIIARRGILESGVHFIQKPFGRSALSRKLREALGRE